MTAVCNTPTRTTSPVPGALPPVKCASWCTDGDGHVNERHAHDQVCYSEQVEVPLLREPLVEMVTVDGDRRWVLDDARATLIRERFEGEPHVDLKRGECGPGMSLTLDECETFGNALLALVSAARQD
jgi:hypothetical protein